MPLRNMMQNASKPALRIETSFKLQHLENGEHDPALAAAPIIIREGAEGCNFVRPVSWIHFMVLAQYQSFR